MWNVHIVLSLVLCLGLTSAVRVKINKKSIVYIADEYNAMLEPLEFKYNEELVERVAVDKRGFVYAVGDDRLSVLKVGKNRQLRLVHTQQFEDGTELESVQTCNGIVTVAARIERGGFAFVDGEEEEPVMEDIGAMLVYRTYNKHMPGDMKLIHSVQLPEGPEHHQITRDCKRIIVALEQSSRIGIITFGDSIYDDPTLKVLGFEDFEDMKDALEEDWLLFEPEVTFEEAFDPEWVCLNKKETMAFVNLKNNNGYAKVDLTPGNERITKLGSYMLLDWSINGPTEGADFSDEPEQIARLQHLPIFSAYNPEQISCITIKKQDCIVLAGEGLTDNSPLFEESLSEVEFDPSFGEDIATAAVAGDIQVIVDSRTDTDDDGDLDIIVTTGSRGFDIRCGGDLAIKASTGSDLERLTMNSIVYNADIDDDETLAERFDRSSDERGPEPETVITKLICGGRYVLMIGISEDPGYLWAYTLDTWNMEAGFTFQDKMHGYKRTDSRLTDEELYKERQVFLRNAEGIAFIQGKHDMSRRNKGIVSIVVGSKITSSVETYDLKFQCRSNNGRNRH